MNKLSYLDKIYNQELFTSRDKVKYFEGWYFKNSFENIDNNNSNNLTISFIPGICKNNIEHYAFIQVICNHTKSFFVKYDIKKFKYYDNPFKIKLKKRRYLLNLTITIKNSFKLVSPNGFY